MQEAGSPPLAVAGRAEPGSITSPSLFPVSTAIFLKHIFVIFSRQCDRICHYFDILDAFLSFTDSIFFSVMTLPNMGNRLSNLEICKDTFGFATILLLVRLFEITILEFEKCIEERKKRKTELPLPGFEHHAHACGKIFQKRKKKPSILEHRVYYLLR